MPAPSPLHEAVAVHVPRAARRRGVVVARGQRARGAEPADAERADRRFGAAGDHHVGVAVLDQPTRLADAVVRGRARRDDREVRALVAVVDRRQAGDHVDDRARHEERGDLAPAPGHVRGLRLLDQRQAADARADADADALLVAGVVGEPGVRDRVHRRREAVVDEGVVAPRFLRRKVLADVEILHLGRDARRKRRAIETRDGADARARVADRVPGSGRDRCRPAKQSPFR